MSLATNMREFIWNPQSIMNQLQECTLRLLIGGLFLARHQCLVKPAHLGWRLPNERSFFRNAPWRLAGNGAVLVLDNHNVCNSCFSLQEGQMMEIRKCEKCGQIDWKQGFHIPCKCNQKVSKWRKLEVFELVSSYGAGRRQRRRRKEWQSQKSSLTS